MDRGGRNEKRRQMSFSRRLIKVWIFGVAIPLVLVEILFLAQFYRINYREVEESITSDLNRMSREMTDLMDNMKMLSWLMEADGTVGKNLVTYLEERDSAEKGNLLVYLREQIANYEVANPSVANLTYLYIPKGQKEPVKINQSSLVYAGMPAEEDFLCKWENIAFYGPHKSKSMAGEYECISLLRRYRTLKDYGEIYIYVESGFRYLDELDMGSMADMNSVLLMQSADGKIMYSSNEEVAAKGLDWQKGITEVQMAGERYQIYSREMKGDWQLHILVPTREHYRLVYRMALNLGLITLFVISFCLLISVLQWRNTYKAFNRFDEGLRAIAEDEDVESRVERMNIREFDEHFELFDKMKKNILRLLGKVQEEEKRRRELEVRVVLGKINPHFLYNTLDTLKWYAAGKQDREMTRFITALNRLLLYNMSRDDGTTLERELEAIGAYIVLQQLRYDIRFVVDTGKHPEILQTVMPRFILQPVVENAIKHSGCNKGEIRIEVELLASGKISILVKNNGSPIDPEKIRQVLEQKQDVSANGIGLQYVARMLESFYGSEFVLQAERLEDGFNVVEIRIPFAAEAIVKEARGICPSRADTVL
ncbi:sensor histidine kinase [uncultured Acetatifactor sp.]|uniref:sensor histidine kinase n=1 Tax=uncultured Acetatifactor sp. TaxID=1671927 RepID=UPI0026091440|nr:histidine kinase [uncultured Acetatifactor sp.]